MSAHVGKTAQAEVDYPEDDGLPLADNTLQYEWIVTIKGGLDAVFRDDPSVFVAGNLLWYPIEGNNTIRIAPDAMVVFGRPKGYRGSYLQWREGGIAPRVVFEVQSPGNRPAEMIRKYRFYDRYGVEEYYLFNPETIELSGWQRAATGLEEIQDTDGWVSPRLGIRFNVNDELHIYGPDGTPFSTYVALARERDEIAHERDAERLRADRLAAQLRALGIEPEG